MSSLLFRRLSCRRTPRDVLLSFRQRRSYLLLSTTLNPKVTPQLPKDLPAPPKTVILLTSADQAVSLTSTALSPLTNNSSATVLAAALDSVLCCKEGNSSRVAGHSWLITDHALPIKIPDSEPESLTFTLPTASISLALAKTVFQTGKNSTYVYLPATATRKVVEAAEGLSKEEVEEFANAQEDIQAAWQELGDLMKVVGVKAGLADPTHVPPNSIQVQLPAELLESPGKVYSRLPLFPLTKARQIREGMGNILRELTIDSETFKPASKELEAAVDKYIQTLPETDKVPARVDVFARLTKNEPASHHPGELFLTPDARLHRILSGGGGWGPRAGLLSLDPQGSRDVANFADEFTKRFEGSTESHGGIVKKGEWVQFYVAENRLADGKGLHFGAVGSVEDMRMLPKDSGEERTIHGCFGGASELGVDVAFAGTTRKMNVPGGNIIVDA